MLGIENNDVPNVNGIRVFLVDDHPVVRFGLQKLLENEEDFSVVGDADCCQQCLDCIQQTRPDVLILDLDLGDACGSEAVATIKSHYPDLPIVVYSGANSQELIAEVVQQGAISYVLKDSSASCLFEAVRSAAQQQTYLDPVVTNIYLLALDLFTILGFVGVAIILFIQRSDDWMVMPAVHWLQSKRAQSTITSIADA